MAIKVLPVRKQSENKYRTWTRPSRRFSQQIGQKAEPMLGSWCVESVVSERSGCCMSSELARGWFHASSQSACSTAFSRYVDEGSGMLSCDTTLLRFDGRSASREGMRTVKEFAL